LRKALRLVAQISRGALIVWWYFPRLEQAQRLVHIQQWASRILEILHIEIECTGVGSAGRAGLIVANHLSWLDILVIQSLSPGVFVAKAEVRHWPVFGAMAQACATIFVERLSLRSTSCMVDSTVAAMEQGWSVVAFPEGTSSDGSTVAAFHANIFEAAIRAAAQVQPLALRYVNPETGVATQAALFIGEMGLLTSLRQIMATSAIRAQVRIGGNLSCDGHTRKSLARQAHQRVQAQLLELPGVNCQHA
jgi:1-acyl-sn-glycerol-3-phosphate acyltransferase